MPNDAGDLTLRPGRRFGLGQGLRGQASSKNKDEQQKSERPISQSSYFNTMDTKDTKAISSRTPWETLHLSGALTLDSDLLERLDELVERRRFRNRSQAIESALADKLQRLARTRLARESAKLNPREEKRLADEGLADDFASWPEY